MYPYDIEIDAHKANENEYWRTERLQRVLAYAQALADIDNNESFHRKLAGLNDEKGHLTVSWLVDPTEAEKNYINKAWNSIVADFEENQPEHK